MGESTNQLLPAAVKLSPPFPHDETCLCLQIRGFFSEPHQRLVVLMHPPAVKTHKADYLIIFIYNKHFIPSICCCVVMTKITHPWLQKVVPKKHSKSRLYACVICYPPFVECVLNVVFLLCLPNDAQIWGDGRARGSLGNLQQFLTKCAR